MGNILDIARKNFYKVMSRQNTQWDLIDAGLVFDEDAKPVKVKKEKKNAKIELC